MPSAAITICAVTGRCWSNCFSRTVRSALDPPTRSARVPGKNCTPAAIACRTSAWSKLKRVSAMPPGNANVAETPREQRRNWPKAAPPSCVGSQPKSTSARHRSARGLRHAPHTLSRGKSRLSTSRTRMPSRANSRAATAPAGPPPTTTTCQVCAPAASSESVASIFICSRPSRIVAATFVKIPRPPSLPRWRVRGPRQG